MPAPCPLYHSITHQITAVTARICSGLEGNEQGATGAERIDTASPPRPEQ